MKNYKKYLIVLVLCLTVLSGCDLPGLENSHSDGDVRITSLEASESRIISCILGLLIEHDTKDEIKPALINNLGPSMIQHNTVTGGQASMSGARYIGTDLTGALKEDPIRDPKEVMKAIQEGFKKKYNRTFFNSHSFENTYTLIVTKGTARKYHLETISDLEKHARDLRVGMDNSWMDRKGDDYPALEKEYGHSFDIVRPMQASLVYDAPSSGELDVIVGYSTDGHISAYDLEVLEDDCRSFPPYDASPLTSDQLPKEKPKLRPIVKRLEDKISTEQIQELNYQAGGKGKEPVTVTEGFLKKHHYFGGDGNRKDKQKGGQ